MLQELGELGMTLARAVTEQAVAQAAGEGSGAGDPGLMFSRIARAVRMTIALEAKLADELADSTARAKAGAHFDAQRRAHAPVAEREATIRRAVARAIRLDVHDEEDEDLLEALDGHLEDWSQGATFLDRPIGDLVARICKDLGVAANPILWEDEDWAIEEAAVRKASPPGATERGEGRERGDAAPDPVPPGPAMTHPSLTHPPPA